MITGTLLFHGLKKVFLYNRDMKFRSEMRETLKMILIMTAASMICRIIDTSRYDNANIITVYLLAVLVVAVVNQKRLYAMIAAIASIMLFNFLFTDPRFTFFVYDTRYIVTYLVLFVASVIAGTLAGKLKENAEQSEKNAYGANVLLEASDQLQTAESEKEIISLTCRTIEKILNTSAEFVTEKTRLPDMECIPVGEYGFLMIDMKDRKMDPFNEHLTLALIDECVLSLTNRKNAKNREIAEINAEKQKFRADLLRSISHDLRTPLTSINGDACALIENSEKMDASMRMTLYQDIRDDSEWLENMVENLLAVTRIQEGSMLRKSVEIIDDVVEEAMQHIDRRGSRDHIHIVSSGEILSAEMDVHMIQQVIVNLVNNAIQYCPEGTDIWVITGRKDDMIEISVKDNGNGIAPEERERVFEMFYSGKHSVGDAGRNSGLGLALCRSIVEAHGGTIELHENSPHGCVFCFTLPAREVLLDESV